MHTAWLAPWLTIDIARLTNQLDRCAHVKWALIPFTKKQW